MRSYKEIKEITCVLLGAAVKRSERIGRHALWFAFLSFILPAAGTIGAIGAIAAFNRDLLKAPQVQLPIVLAIVLAVLGGLSFLVIVLSDLGLTTRDPAILEILG